MVLPRLLDSDRHLTRRVRGDALELVLLVRPIRLAVASTHRVEVLGDESGSEGSGAIAVMSWRLSCDTLECLRNVLPSKQ